MNVKSSLFSFPCQGLVSLTLIHKVSLCNCKTYIRSTISTDSLNGPVFSRNKLIQKHISLWSPYSNHLVFRFQDECRCMNINSLWGYQECMPNSTEFPETAIIWMSSICNVFRLISSTSNLNLSRIKPDRKRV